MKKAGVYMVKETGVIWHCEKVEYFEPSIVCDKSGGFSIVISGQAGNQRINRCLITKKQFKLFKYLGRF